MGIPASRKPPTQVARIRLRPQPPRLQQIPRQRKAWLYQKTRLSLLAIASSGGRVNPGGVAGTWVALFGRAEAGVFEAYKVNGYVLKLGSNGEFSIVATNGKPANEVLEPAYMNQNVIASGTYKADGERVLFSSFTLTGTGDISGYTPLGMGRDDEIGLLGKEQEGMGRDDEIGLVDKEKEGMGRDDEIGLLDEGQSDSQGVSEYMALRKDAYLVLINRESHCFVFGDAVLGQQAGDIPSGAAVASFAGEMLDSQLAANGDILTLEMGPRAGTLNASKYFGYYTGRTEGAEMTSYAALLDTSGVH